jgi:hypothetical protein
MSGFLSDRRRVELALPAYMASVCLDRTFPEKSEAVRRVLGLLDQAWGEALDAAPALDPGRRRQLSRRLSRLWDELVKPHEWDVLMKVWLMVLFWLRDLLEDGRLVLVAGSAFDQAMSEILPELERHGDLWDGTERSARKHARKLQQHLESLGYYRGNS